MLRLYLYARVRFSHIFAHETAGAASTRHSLRPLFLWANDFGKTRAHRAARWRSRILWELYSVEATSLRPKRLVRRSSTSEGGSNPLSPPLWKDGLLRFARNDGSLNAEQFATTSLLRASGDCRLDRRLMLTDGLLHSRP